MMTGDDHAEVVGCILIRSLSRLQSRYASHWPSISDTVTALLLTLWQRQTASQAWGRGQSWLFQVAVLLLVVGALQ